MPSPAPPGSMQYAAPSSSPASDLRLIGIYEREIANIDALLAAAERGEYTGLCDEYGRPLAVLPVQKDAIAMRIAELRSAVESRKKKVKK